MSENDADELSRDIRETVRDLIESISVQNGQTVADTKYAYVLISVIVAVIVLLLAVMFLHLFIRSREKKIQRQRFRATVDLIKDSYFNAASKTPGVALGSPVNPQGSDRADFEELSELAASCEVLGDRIDRHTNRLENSKAVSELVFKISMALGLDKKICTLYFCAAMVYDAGFLDLPQELFFSEILSVSERNLMKTHVMRFAEFMDFVPVKYYTLFAEAATLHHENMNGSGYPEGLEAAEIPQLPRILHVVESYISLVKRRSYHKILSKKDALIELKRRKGIYDADIISILETLI